MNTSKAAAVQPPSDKPRFGQILASRSNQTPPSGTSERCGAVVTALYGPCLSFRGASYVMFEPFTL